MVTLADRDSRPWLSLRAIARVLGITPDAAAVLARQGRLGSQLLPGQVRRTYSRADAVRVAAESRTRATPAAPDVDVAS